MALISKKKFLENKNHDYKDVEIKGLDGEIRIKALSIADQIEFENIAADQSLDESTLMFQLILKCCIDEDGEALFEDGDLEDLKKQPADMMVQLFKEILKMNSIDQGEVDAIAKK